MKRIYTVTKGLFCCVYEFNFHSFIIKDTGRVLLAFFVGGILLCASAPVVAQTSASSQTTSAMPAKPGTYQIILNSRKGDREITLTTQQLIIIEQLRKDNEVVCAMSTRNDDLRIKILPRNIINRPDFKPIPLKYYKDEESYEEHHNFRYVEFQ